MEAESGMVCEAKLMGSWLRARVLRVGRDGEVDLELDDGTELEGVEESRLRPARGEGPQRPRRGRASSWECLEALALDAHARNGGGGRPPRLRGEVERERDEFRRLELLLGRCGWWLRPAALGAGAWPGRRGGNAPLPRHHLMPITDEILTEFF